MDKQVPLYTYAGPGHWNEPDMLEVGIGHMSFYENRSHFTMWCMLAAPLILGADVPAMSKDIMDIISNEDVIAIDQDPLGKQAFRFISNNGIDIWAKPLVNDRFAVAILNKKDEN